MKGGEGILEGNVGSWGDIERVQRLLSKVSRRDVIPGLPRFRT